MKKAFIILLTLLFTFTSTAVFAAENDDDGVAITMDLIILRPIGIATFIGGLGLFVLTLPPAVVVGTVSGVIDGDVGKGLGKSVGKTGTALVVKPTKYLFVRHLGDNDNNDTE
jgi:hypothetical protein